MTVIKIGTIDDLKVQDELRPDVEQFWRTRVGWLKREGMEGVVEGSRGEEGNFFC